MEFIDARIMMVQDILHQQNPHLNKCISHNLSKSYTTTNPTLACSPCSKGAHLPGRDVPQPGEHPLRQHAWSFATPATRKPLGRNHQKTNHTLLAREW